MRGLVRLSPRCLATYRDGKRFTDAYQLLITKKPVEYDYVAIDVNSFFGGAQRLAKNVSQEQRKNREVSRHVLNAIQQLLRRVVCKRSLLFAFDGAGTAETVYGFRTGRVTRRVETRQQRLPGTSLARAVEERVVKAMPLPRTLIPREVVISGTTVEGCVERKVAAWALDLACRDGAQQHTTRSLCLIGSTTLWFTMLGLTPYYQSTHVIHGSADMRHMTLNDALSWLELDTHVQSGDTHAVSTGRTDALLLMLLAMGCELTELPVLGGVNLTVLMEAYHRWRSTSLNSEQCVSPPIGLTAAAAAAASLTEKVAGTDGGSSKAPAAASASASPAARFQLLRELPNRVLEIDLLALYLLFIPEREAAAEVAKLESNATSPFSHPVSSPQPSTSSCDDWAEVLVKSTSVADSCFDSFLAHLLSTHYLLCYGETTADLLAVPFYFTHRIPPSEKAPSGGNGGRGDKKAAVSSNPSSGSSTNTVGPSTADAETSDKGNLSVSGWIPFLRRRIRCGRRYHVMCPTPPPALLPGSASSTDQDAVTSGSAADEKLPASAAEGTALTSAAASLKTYYPFWTKQQPLTSAEYTILCQTSAKDVEHLLKEYVPAFAHRLKPDLLRDLASSRLTFTVARDVVQRLLARASSEPPHPSTCFGPSYCWNEQEKSRMWHMRYIDLGTRAMEMDIRHARSLLQGMRMAQQRTEDGAVLFDAVEQAWVTPPSFPPPLSPLTASPTSSSSSSSPEGQKQASPSDVSAPTLKVVTWNVMFDRYSGQPTPLGMPGIDWCSPKRYPVLAKIIAEEDADVVGMQEVELAFAEYLAEQPWCRERYIMSCRPRSSVLDPWGVLLLVRRGSGAWPVHQLTHLNVPAWSGHVSLMPVVTLDLARRQQHDGERRPNTSADRATRLVNVCSMHLLAPYLKAHETARTGQDQALRQCLTRQLHGDTIVMGDFNDWPSNEFSMPVETRYVECWPVVHPDNYGKTMDESNTFCKLKIEEMFFGRSDKLFLRTGGGPANLPPLLKPVAAHLVGTRSVNAENGNHDAPEYLFPSDHYGVSMTFQVLPHFAKE
jgi:endonuclease/exonuclease/phosphatase family metal-dependent hydrolase